MAGKQAYRISELVQLIGVSRSTIYRLIKENKFPRPLKIGKISLWAKEDIERWLKELREGSS